MKKKTKPGAIQQLLSYAGNNKKQLYLSTFLATLGELFGMAPFITVSLLVAELFNKTATIQNVCILFAVALGGQILKLWLTYQSSFMSHKATYKILKNIRSKIADKMLRVPMGVMLDTPTGNFKNLMADTVSKLEDSMAHFMPEITSNVVAPLCCILLVFILDWRMGLAALITIPLGLLGYIGMMNDYVNKSTTYMKSQNAMNSTLVEYVNGIEVIKAFNQGSASYSKFTGAINFFHDSTLAWWKQSWLWSAVIQAVMPTTLLGTLPIGAWLYMTGTLPLSDFITCIILPIGFIAPLMRVGKYSEQFNMVKACLDQIRDFIEKPELKRPEKNVALDETAYRFENVSFAYNETEVLKNVSFEIKPGTVSAIVGPSGSGKSTIAKLMAGFWDATKGKVIFGGKNIKEIPFAQLMGEVSYSFCGYHMDIVPTNIILRRIYFMQTENKKGFQVKDLIVTALLSLCALVIYIICAFLSFSPYTMLVVSPLWSLLAAITYFLVAAKTKKPWALFIFCAVTGIYGFYPPMIICCIIAGIISALIARKTGCTNGKTLTFSYIIYMVLAAFSGTYIPFLFFSNQTLEQYAGMFGESYLGILQTLVSPVTAIIMLVVVAICAFVGALIAKKLLKKHFKKAGMV